MFPFPKRPTETATPVAHEPIYGSITRLVSHLKAMDTPARYVMIPVSDDIGDSISKSTLEALSSASKIILKQGVQSHDKAFNKLMDCFALDEVPSPNVVREATMQLQAQQAILQSGDWITAADLAKIAGLSRTNPSAQPNKWKRDGTTFAISHGGRDYFPVYGLDATAGYRPRSAMAEVIRTFGDTKNGWGMAFWFASVNAYLGGLRPQDVLATDGARVIAAAKEEVSGVTHG